MLRRYPTLILGLTIVWTCQPQAAAESVGQLRGDPAAIERVTKMLDQMGGADMWARSGHLYTEQSGWFTGPSEAAMNFAWRSLVSPARHAHIVGRHTDTIHVVNDTEGWTSRKGVVTEMSADDHARQQETWQNGSYTMLARLARGDQALQLEFVEPHRVRILDEDGEEISWYDINEYGHWMKWGQQSSNGTPLEYVYGPMRDFGNIRFPAWGAATDASWRYNYDVVRLRFEPIPAKLLQRTD